MEGEERPLAQESLKQHWIRRPCLWVAFAIKWLPVFFITGVIAWSYYALVVALCIQTITSLGEQVVILIFYHVILVLFVSSYWKTIFSPICETPQKWFLSTAMVEKLNKAKSEQDWKNLLEMFVIEMELPVVQRSIQGAIRYCDKCKAIKPDRSHHCSVCGVCVLKMDHHCPWVNNCVAFYNYKFFMLFLGYALIYCLFLVASVFKYFIWMPRKMIGVIYGGPVIDIRHERLAGQTIETVYEGLSDKLKALGEDARAKKAQTRLVGPIENYGNRLEYSVTKLLIKFNLMIICQLIAKIRDKVIRQQLCIWLAAHMNLKPQAIIDLGRWTGGPNNPGIIEFRMGGSQAIRSRNRRMTKMIAAAAGATEFGLN